MSKKDESPSWSITDFILVLIIILAIFTLILTNIVMSNNTARERIKSLKVQGFEIGR